MCAVESLELEALDVEFVELVEFAALALSVALADDVDEVEELESTPATRSASNVVSAFDRSVRSEANCEAVEDDALEAVDALETLETLDDELDESSAVSRLVRSVSNSDSRLLALDELTVELDEVELLETPGGGPGGGPPAPWGPCGPPPESPLAELWLLSDETLLSCDRKASIADDRPIADDASEDDTVLLVDVDAEVDVLVLDWSEELLWLAQFA